MSVVKKIKLKIHIHPRKNKKCRAPSHGVIAFTDLFAFIRMRTETNKMKVKTSFFFAFEPPPKKTQYISILLDHFLYITYLHVGPIFFFPERICLKKRKKGRGARQREEKMTMI